MGLAIDNLTMEETISIVEDFIKSGKPHQHVVINVNKAVKAAKNMALRQIINNCDLVSADGMPIVWASRMLGKGLKERVSGIDLFINLLEVAEKKNFKVYFLGATAEVVDKVIEVVGAKHPELIITGWRNGYWNSGEESQIVEKIKTSRPDILFIAIPSPQKEIFSSRNLRNLDVPFVMGVGGSFDVLAGKTKRAPLWMQKSGLEWFYRFLQEPGRLFKRYFIEGTYFLIYFFKELFSTRLYPAKNQQDV